MRYLSRNDLETIGIRITAAYKQLPEVASHPFERVDIDFLAQQLLGLRVDYAHLSRDQSKLGLTATSEIGVEVFPENEASTEELFYMLDGKTLLIESDLIREGACIGRRNYTVSHEACHHILRRLYPSDYIGKTSERRVHFCYRSSAGTADWEEWQVETLASIILLPAECVRRCMALFGLGTHLYMLNRVFASVEFARFEQMAAYLGASKTALAIRMKQLGLLTRNELSDPYVHARIDMD